MKGATNFLVSIFVLFTFLPNKSISQITITSEDISNTFALGHTAEVHEFDGSASVDIGHSGGDNNWDFSGLSQTLTYNFFSVDKGAAPNPEEFPDADIVVYNDGSYQGQQAEIWSYYSLDNAFNNLGAAAKISFQPGDLVSIKNNPPRIEGQFPLTYNSSWTSAYNQMVSINGMGGFQTPITLDVDVDAYGTMQLPGGGSYDALRMRQTMTVSTVLGDSTSVTYFFMTKSGAQVSLNAPTGAVPPDNGVISVESYSWNDSLENKSLGFGSPSTDDLVIAGERETIHYANQVGNVDLYYRAGRGNDFVLLDTSYTSPESKYVWDVPESLLTTNAIIKVVDNEDTVSFIHKISYSGIFKIKPWQLTRINDNSEFDLFELGQDNWKWINKSNNMWPESWYSQFNYFNGTDPYTGRHYAIPFKVYKGSRFMDWPLFVDVFGVDNCYFSVGQRLIYKPAAILRWIGISDKKWGGSCFGFAISGLEGFYHPNGITPFIGNYSDLNSQPLSDDVRYAINYYFLFQWGHSHRKYRRQHIRSTTPRDLLTDLKETLSRVSGDGRSLSFYNNNGSGGHAVVPYKLERIDNSSNFKVLLYNSNAPADSDNFIYIDSVANTWSDSTGLKWGTGSDHCFLREDSREYLPPPGLFRSLYTNFTPDAVNEMTVDDPRLTIYNTTDADVILTSTSGAEIGYSDSLAFNNVDDAVALIPETGSFSPPLGYDVPEGNYSVALNNFLDTLSYVIFDEDSTYYYYRRNAAETNQSDLLQFNTDGLSFKNPDAAVKNIYLETVIVKDTSQDVFYLDNMNISQGDSINVGEQGRNILLIKNYGSEKSYDLKIQKSSAAGEVMFNHHSISLPDNSSHTIIPDWNALDTNPVKILIDEGNDGTIDDSIFASNESTDVQNMFASGIPEKFSLSQNYPNPFNPVTTINYALPKDVDVQLVVYDITGRQVKTLVNKRQSAGRHQIHWNGTNVFGEKVAGGLYFYTISAGTITQTGKMILLK